MRSFAGVTCAFAFAALGVAACSSQSQPTAPILASTPSPMPTATLATSAPITMLGATPPASLALLTPAPGLPTVLPISATMGPPNPSESPLSHVAYPSVAPAPIASADAAALVAGTLPSQAFFASLAAPITPAYPLADSAPKGVIGTIEAFLPNAIIIDVAPALDASAATAAKLSYAGGVNAIAATRVVAQIDSKTLDFVPGGLAQLHVGSAIAVLGAGSASAFTAVAVIAGLGSATPTASSSSHAAFAAPIRSHELTARTIRLTRSDVRAANVTSQTAFAISNSTGFAGYQFPSPPSNFVIGDLGCLHEEITFAVSAGLGETATYPMLLQDVSDPMTYVESSPQPLPVRLVNAPSTGATTYAINYGLSVTGAFNFTLNNCPFYKPGVFPLSASIGAIGGQGFSASTTDPLPGRGNISLLAHNTCPFISLPVSAKLFSTLLNLFNSPSMTICLDFQLDGGNIGADAQLTHAQVLGSSSSSVSGSDTSYFSWLSSLPSGDPQLTVVPRANPTDGSMQSNTLTLNDMTYDGNLTLMPSLSISGFGLVIPTLEQNPLPVLTVFQQPSARLAPPFQTLPGINNPNPVSIQLTPFENQQPVRGK